MILGNKTIQYAIYDRSPGRPDYICDTSSYKRPSLENLTDTIKGAGILGEIDMPSLGQLGSMELEITYKRSNVKAIELFGQKSQHIETRWVTDALNSVNGSIKTDSNKEIIKCIPKKLDLGSIEANATNEVTGTYEIIYYQYIVNGESLIEIDKLNNVFKIRGIDYAEAIRKAL